MTIVGEITVDLRLEWTGGSVDVVVRVDRVAPDGTDLLIVEQGSRIESSPGVHRIAAGSTAWYVDVGDRIRVSVSLSSWPRLEVGRQEATVHVRHTAPDECAVRLPRLEGTTR